MKTKRSPTEVCGVEGAAEEQQRQVDVGPTVVADRQATEALEPGEGALDDPALATQRGLLLPSHRDVAAQPVHSAVDAVGAVVVGFIRVRGLDALVLGQRRLSRLQHLREGQAFGPVGGAERGGQGHALLVGHQMVLAPGLAAVARVGAGMFAPLLAGTSEESSITSLARS